MVTSNPHTIKALWPWSKGPKFEPQPDSKKKAPNQYL